MRLAPHLACFISLTFAFVLPARAQQHFSACQSGTGNIFNATAIVPTSAAPSVNGTALARGSEIAVFTSSTEYSNQCVGVLVWEETSAAITVWGDDPITSELDGLQSGGQFLFKIWDARLNFEFSSNSILASFSKGSFNYSNDEIYVVARLDAFWSSTGITTLDDAVFLDEDSEVFVDVVENDISANGEPLHVTQISEPKHGSAAIADDGRIRYQPRDNFFGQDSLNYIVSNGAQSLKEGTLRLDIAPINDAPIFTSSPPRMTIAGHAYAFNVRAIDVEADSVLISSISLPTWMSFEPNGSGGMLLSGLPGLSEIGDHPVSLSASDGTATSTLEFTLTVVGFVNKSPTSRHDEFSTDEDQPTILDVLANDIDPDGDSLFVSSFESIPNISIALRPDGMLDFIPSENVNGSFMFSYTVSDLLGASSESDVTVEVRPVNDPPVFLTQPELLAAPNHLYRYEIGASDVDGDALVFSLANAPDFLDLEVDGNGVPVVYGVPADDDTGLNPVILAMTDGEEVVLQEFIIDVVGEDELPEPNFVVPSPAPEGNSDSVVASSNHLVSWMPVDEASHYHFQLTDDRSDGFSSLVREESELETNHLSLKALKTGAVYEWRVRAAVGTVFSPWSEIQRFRIVAPVESPGDDEPDLVQGPPREKPSTFSLLQNYPNPFNPETTISFDVPSSIRVRIHVFDMVGHLVAILLDKRVEAGHHSLRWRAIDLPSGIYIYQMSAGNFVQSKTLSLIK